MTEVSLDALLKRAEGLITLPEIAIRVNRMVNDTRVSAPQIGQVIQQDPALTARLLKVANSPLYGFAAKIDTVSRAVTVLGTKEIRDLVLATSALKAFNIKPGVESLDALWSHNIYCAIAVRLLAEQCKQGQAESLFISGLLHDLGRLLFLSLLPDESQAVLRRISGRGELGLFQAEREVIGFDHAEAGGELIKRWSLPASLEETVRFHHEPARAEHFPLEVALVHLADAVAHAAQSGADIEAYLPGIDAVVWERTGLELDDLEPIVRKVQAQFKGVRAALGGK